MLRRLKTCGYETCGYCNLTREAIRRCEVRFGALASEAIRRCEVHFGALESEAICHGERFFVAITSEAIFLFDFLPSQGRIKERFPLKRCHTGVFFVVLSSEAIRRCEVRFGALTSEAICHGERFFVALSSEAIFLFSGLPPCTFLNLVLH